MSRVLTLCILVICNILIIHAQSIRIDCSSSSDICSRLNPASFCSSSKVCELNPLTDVFDADTDFSDTNLLATYTNSTITDLSTNSNFTIVTCNNSTTCPTGSSCISLEGKYSDTKACFKSIPIGSQCVDLSTNSTKLVTQKYRLCKGWGNQSDQEVGCHADTNKCTAIVPGKTSESCQLSPFVPSGSLLRGNSTCRSNLYCDSSNPANQTCKLVKFVGSLCKSDEECEFENGVGLVCDGCGEKRCVLPNSVSNSECQGVLALNALVYVIPIVVMMIPLALCFGCWLKYRHRQQKSAKIREKQAKEDVTHLDTVHAVNSVATKTDFPLSILVPTTPVPEQKKSANLSIISNASSSNSENTKAVTEYATSVAV